jgi:hypothetical protein
LIIAADNVLIERSLRSSLNPVAMLDERLGFVGLASGQSILLTAAGPKQYRSEEACHYATEYSEFGGHFLADRGSRG